MSSIRGPLLFALMVSPMCLLLQRNLERYPKKDMLQKAQLSNAPRPDSMDQPDPTLASDEDVDEGAVGKASQDCPYPSLGGREKDISGNKDGGGQGLSQGVSNPKPPAANMREAPTDISGDDDASDPKPPAANTDDNGFFGTGVPPQRILWTMEMPPQAEMILTQMTLKVKETIMKPPHLPRDCFSLIVTRSPTKAVLWKATALISEKKMPPLKPENKGIENDDDVPDLAPDNPIIIKKEMGYIEEVLKLEETVFSQKIVIDLKVDFPEPPLIDQLTDLEADKVDGEHTYTIYGATADDITEFTPCFHFPLNMDTIDRILRAAHQIFIDGKPHHIADPKILCLKVMKHEEFAKLSPHEAMSELKKRHFLIIGVPCDGRKFDAATLSLLGNLKTARVVHDHSVPQPDRRLPKDVPPAPDKQLPKVNTNCRE
ncbi:hypothetical protein DXG01_016670 [Tephrocybe rancida]|nr:hypothetical protein DXG01_016670 [Tephrocybe rancida]